MAKFSDLFSAGSGSIGNLTVRSHTTSKGTRAMVISSKVSNPKNPRTSAQMLQRAKFATAAKFYRRATRNFFRFAYEDKRSNESWYNAFMRHNINKAVPMIKAQCDNDAYPAIGKYWQLTDGSLEPLQCSFVNNNNAWYTDGEGFQFLTVASEQYKASGALGVGEGESGFPSMMTVGQLSQLLRTKGYKEGQIFTLVVVSSEIPIEAFDLTDADTIAAQNYPSPVWNISQFVINTASTDFVGDIASRNTNYFNWLSIDSPDETGETKIRISFPGGSAAYFVAAAAMVTENTTSTSKLLASPSTLLPNSKYAAYLAKLETSDYYNKMLESWKVEEDDAILKGSIATRTDDNGNSGINMVAFTEIGGSAVPYTEELSNDSITELEVNGANLDTVTNASLTVSNCKATISASSSTAAKLSIDCTSSTVGQQATVKYGAATLVNSKVIAGTSSTTAPGTSNA